MIKFIAFDIGGVLAYPDKQQLTNHEKLLLQAYLNEIKMDSELEQEVTEKINGIYQKLYIPIEKNFQTLESVVKSGYLPSIWTNNRPAITAWIKSSGIDKYLLSQFLCNSCNMPNGINKPNFMFYIHALRQMGALANQVLFIDDNKKNIVEGEKLRISGIHYQADQNLEEEIKQKIKQLERKHL